MIGARITLSLVCLVPSRRASFRLVYGSRARVQGKWAHVGTSSPTSSPGSETCWARDYLQSMDRTTSPIQHQNTQHNSVWIAFMTPLGLQSRFRDKLLISECDFLPWKGQKCCISPLHELKMGAVKSAMGGVLRAVPAAAQLLPVGTFDNSGKLQNNPYE